MGDTNKADDKSEFNLGVIAGAKRICKDVFGIDFAIDDYDAIVDFMKEIIKGE